ncbi:hypothetical protein [Chitinophaga silvisoli]|uniref:Uncharacterized protein n=1 Tax=Chitinophaga silvisoli TaxID=2291814 RepID=A0A3E1NUM4_9BACT|nr:hypothetical protein [Chitinophaga silvisoli]RFM31603.1 hypothetical protein DXN04_28225 [Chitinophaga silvisoli]
MDNDNTVEPNTEQSKSETAGKTRAVEDLGSKTEALSNSHTQPEETDRNKTIFKQQRQLKIIEQLPKLSWQVLIVVITILFLPNLKEVLGKVNKFKGYGVEIELKSTLSKHSPDIVKIFCCYDTDAFELVPKPPTNWTIVRKAVAELGIDTFHEIKAKRMIEDWFLVDLAGLCKYLRISLAKKLARKGGLEKIKTLFKKGTKPKIYQIGLYVHKFLPNLNLSKLTVALNKELAPIELALGIKKTEMISALPYEHN